MTRYADVMGQPPGHQPSPAQPSPAQHTCPFFKQVLAGAQCRAQAARARPCAVGCAGGVARTAQSSSDSIPSHTHTSPHLASVCSPHVTM